MIGINLLPDIKQEYLKSQRIKRTILAISFLVSAGVISIVVLFGIFVFVGQRVHLSGLQKDIDNTISKLQAIEDLDKIVTIQKQLEKLPELHDKKPAVYRFFQLFLPKLVPNDVNLNAIDIRVTDRYEMEISGEAKDFKAVNTFADTLKFAELVPAEGTAGENALRPFTNVVVDSYDKDDEITSYKIELVFDPSLFDKTQNVTIRVPSIISSPSVTERPGALFQLPVQTDQPQEEDTQNPSDQEGAL